MPITVEYQPAASAIGQPAFAAGMGDWQRWQARQQLAYDQMAQEAAQRQQAMQFQAAQQFFGQQAQAQRQREAMGMDWLRRGADREAEIADMEKRREWATLDRDDEELLKREAATTAFGRQKELHGLQAEEIAKRQAEDDARNMAMARKNQAWDLIGKGTHAYNDAQRREMDRLRGEMNTWKNNKSVPQDVKMPKLAELQQLYDQIEESPDPLRPDERPKSTADKVQEWTSKETMPDGTTLVWNKEIRNGEERVVLATQIDPQGREIDMVKQAQERQKQKQNILTAVSKHKMDALKEYRALHAEEEAPVSPKAMAKIAKEAENEYFAMFPEHLQALTEPDQPRGPTPQQGDEGAFFAAADPQQVHADAFQQQMNAAQQAPQAMPPPQQQPVAGATPMVQPAQQQAMPAMPQGPLAVAGAPVQQAPQIAPGDKPDAPWDENTPLSIQDASNRQLLEIVQNESKFNFSLVGLAKEELEARGVTQAPGMAPLNVAELDAPSQAIAASMLPQPKSKAEFDALEKGMMFIAPDGSVRRK